jgi:hypothetical protein
VTLRRSWVAAQCVANEYASRWFIWEYVLHSTTARAYPAELDLDDPYPEQVLAELNAPSAEAIGCGTTRLKLDCSFGKHFDLLPSVSLADRVNHIPRSKYSNFSTLRCALCAASRSHVQPGGITCELTDCRPPCAKSAVARLELQRPRLQAGIAPEEE